VQLALIPEGSACRPFLKWVGGKRQLLPMLLRRLPTGPARYFEPFLGGGALFFALCPKRAVLADRNERLIRTYRGVRDHVDEVIRLLRNYPHDAGFYDRLREQDIDAASDAELAAWFIYLNKTGFNGLYRVNRSNRFNVPFGDYANPTLCDEPTLRSCSRALAGADLVHGDFAVTVANAERGDLVYFDPPYVPMSETSSFTSYTSDGFGPEDQIRLRDTARTLLDRGVGVLISNSATPFVRRIYAEGFHLAEVHATRRVNSQATGRGAIAELIIS
jgi:DNA adenine methylase